MTGDCDQCISCAVYEPCSWAMDACFSNPQCDQFGMCVENCPGPGSPCYENCVNQYPTGAPLYFDLLYCVFCVECAVDCVAEAPPWLCFYDDDEP